MSEPPVDACPECWASGRCGSCAQLFHALLTLDHQRLQPWGEFHGLNVACYLLQHPSQAPHGVDAEHLQLVTAFLEGGPAAAQRWESDRVRLNRRHRLSTSRRPVPARIRRPTFTIEDLSVDGSFPADGYDERMRRWASSVRQERAGTS
jgi:hypothetical protein